MGISNIGMGYLLVNFLNYKLADSSLESLIKGQLVVVEQPHVGCSEHKPSSAPKLYMNCETDEFIINIIIIVGFVAWFEIIR